MKPANRTTGAWMASGGPGPYWGFDTIRRVMAREKPLGGVGVLSGVGLVLAVLGVLGDDLVVVVFGLALLVMAGSWVLGARRRGRLSDGLEARAREEDLRDGPGGISSRT
jgi:hypothetical protein